MDCRRRIIGSALATLLFIAPGIANAVCTDVSVDICFRPGPVSCSSKIIDAINGVHFTLLVQAYSFTNAEIIQAIGTAHKRGVQVRVLLDKDNQQPRYTGVTYLSNAGIAVRIDERVAIAHNKVMVIDGELVIGGSYNYTKSAETRNAENVTFIRSSCVAEDFGENFEARWITSHTVNTNRP